MISKNFSSRSRSVGEAQAVRSVRFAVVFLGLTLMTFQVFLSAGIVNARAVTISILMANNLRQLTVDGLQKALVEHGVEEGLFYNYIIFNSGGDRSKLPGMAAEIVAGNPDVAIAAGGIEADALYKATSGTSLPVVFLSVSSSVERGIVASMISSGNNFTGIETNDTQLTAKRLWFITKMLPEARRVFCFHMPSIVPSVNSLAIARQTAAELGLEIQVAEVESEQDIAKAAANLSAEFTDVILQFPVSPINRSLQSVILPRAMAENIPVFGYGSGNIESGAFASYAASRYANGQQAARLVHKVLNGAAPTNIPIELPDKLELILNKSQVEKIGLQLPMRVWRMADLVVEIQF